MHLMPRRCARPGCSASVSRVRCQDCGRAFCPDHVAATAFTGYRRPGAGWREWTRFVCAECTDQADRLLVRATTAVVAEQAIADARGHWWSAPPANETRSR